MPRLSISLLIHKCAVFVCLASWIHAGIDARAQEASGQDEDANHALSAYQQVTSRYTDFTTFQADLTCRVRITSDIDHEFQGVLFFQRPNLWRIELTSDRDGKPALVSLYLSDGNYLWQFNPRSGQVQKERISPDSKPPQIHFFPSFQLFDDTRITLRKTASQRRLRLPLKKTASLYASVELILEPEQSIISEMNLLSIQGETNMKIQFHHARFDQAIDPGRFTFANPYELPVAVVKKEAK